MESKTGLDVVVVGAGMHSSCALLWLKSRMVGEPQSLKWCPGLYGIAFAAFYLDVHPGARLAILDRDSKPGGVWNASRSIASIVHFLGRLEVFEDFNHMAEAGCCFIGRHYNTFWSQIGYRLAEFSDMPMRRPPEDEMKNEFFDAQVITEYLEEYLDRHVYHRRSLRDRLVSGFHVETILRDGDNWVVSGHSAANRRVFQAEKLAVATGLTSVPKMPEFKGQEHFKGLIKHIEQFGSSSILSRGDCKDVAVVGGAKSAADMVYATVKAGKSVCWIVRDSGAGPAAFVSGKGKGSYKNSAELGATRIITTFSPSIYAPKNMWTAFLQRTKLGRWLMSSLWRSVDRQASAIFRPGARKSMPGFASLATRTRYVIALVFAPVPHAYYLGFFKLVADLAKCILVQ